MVIALVACHSAQRREAARRHPVVSPHWRRIDRRPPWFLEASISFQVLLHAQQLHLRVPSPGAWSKAQRRHSAVSPPAATGPQHPMGCAGGGGCPRPPPWAAHPVPVCLTLLLRARPDRREQTAGCTLPPPAAPQTPGCCWGGSQGGSPGHRRHSLGSRSASPSRPARSGTRDREGKP